MYICSYFQDNLILLILKTPAVITFNIVYNCSNHDFIICLFIT